MHLQIPKPSCFIKCNVLNNKQYWNTTMGKVRSNNKDWFSPTETEVNLVLTFGPWDQVWT